MREISFRLKKHYLPLFSLVLIAGVILYITWKNRDAITFTAQSTGYISIVLLTVSLVIGPVNLMLKKKNPVSTYFRRDISITAGILAVIHSVSGLFVHLRGKPWLYFLKESEDGLSVRFDSFGLANYTGLVSALIIILLLITSNDYSLKKFTPVKWKNIQRFSYLMFFLAIIHCFYYRDVKENYSLVYWLYIPLFTIVLAFQVTGLFLFLKRKSGMRF